MATQPYMLPSGEIVDLDARIPREEAFALLREQYPDQFPAKSSGGNTSLGSRIVRGGASGVMGLLESATEGAIAPLPDSMEAPLLERTRPFFKGIQERLDPGEEYRGGITQKLSGAAGSMLPFLPFAFLGPPGIAAGVGLGALSGAGDARLRAAAAGEEQSAMRTGLGGLLGATQMVPFSRMAARLNSPVGQSAQEMGEQILRKWGPSTARMFQQRARDILATAGDNAVAAAIYNLGQNTLEMGYNPERGLTDGLVEDASLEAMAGGGLQLLLGGRHARHMNQLSRDMAQQERLRAEAAAAPPPPPTDAGAEAATRRPLMPRTPAETVLHDAEGNEFPGPKPDEIPLTDDFRTEFGETPLPELETAYRQSRTEAEQALADGDRDRATDLLARGSQLRSLSRERWQQEAGLPASATPEQWLQWFAAHPDRMPPDTGRNPVDDLAELRRIDTQLKSLNSVGRRTDAQEKLRRSLYARRGGLIGSPREGASTWGALLRDAGIADPDVRRAAKKSEVEATKAAKAAEKAAKAAEKTRAKVEEQAGEAPNMPPVAETVDPQAGLPARAAGRDAANDPGAIEAANDAQAAVEETPPVEVTEPPVPAETAPPVEDPAMATDTADSPETGALAEEMIARRAEQAAEQATPPGDVAETTEFAALAARANEAMETLTNAFLDGSGDSGRRNLAEIDAILADAAGRDNLPAGLAIRLGELARARDAVRGDDTGNTATDTEGTNADAVAREAIVRGDGESGSDTARAGKSTAVSRRRQARAATRAEAPVEGAVGDAAPVPDQPQRGEVQRRAPLGGPDVSPAFRERMASGEPITMATVAGELRQRWPMDSGIEAIAGELGSIVTRKGVPKAVTKASVREVQGRVDDLLDSANLQQRAQGRYLQDLFDHITARKARVLGDQRTGKPRRDRMAEARADDAAEASGMAQVASFINEVGAELGIPGLQVEVVTHPTATMVRKLADNDLVAARKAVAETMDRFANNKASKADLDAARAKVADIEQQIDSLWFTGQVDPGRQALYNLADNLGTTVVFVRPVKGNTASFDGFTLRGMISGSPMSPTHVAAVRHLGDLDRVVFINEKTKDPLMTLFGHEYLHTVRSRSPADYARFREAYHDYVFGERVTEAQKVEQQAAQQAFLNRMREGGTDMSLAELRNLLDPDTPASKTMTDTAALDLELKLEEALADVTGARMGDPMFWRRMSEASDGTDVTGAPYAADSNMPGLLSIARDLINKFKRAFFGGPRIPKTTPKISEELQRLDNAIRQMFERTHDIEAGIDVQRPPSAARGTVPDTAMGGALTDAGVIPRFDASRAADETRAVLFSRVTDPAQRRVAEDILGRVGPFGSAPIDAGPGMMRDLARQVLPMLKLPSLGRLITAFRQEFTHHAAHVGNRYGEQQTYRADADAVNSTLNGYGMVMQALASGELTHSAYLRGHLELDDFGNFVAAEGDSMGKIQEDVRALSSQYGMDPALMVPLISSYMYGNRVKEVRKSYDRAMATWERALLGGMSRDASHPIRADIDRMEGWLARFDKEGWADAGLEVGQRYPEVVELGKRMQEQVKHVVDLLEKTGRIDKDKADRWRGTEGYIPMFTETTSSQDFSALLSTPITRRTGRKANLSSPGILPELSGSAIDGTVNDVFANMERFMHWGHSQAMNTAAAAALVKEAHIWNDGVPLVRHESEAAIPAQLRISAFDKGKQYFYQVNNPMSVATFNGLRTSTAWKPLQMMANVLRRTVTLAPGFSAGQLVQDSMRAAAMSGVDRPFLTMRRVFGSFAREMTNAVGGAERSATARDLAAHGITPDVDYRQEVIGKLSSFASPSRFGVLGRMYHLSDRMAKASDLAQREAVYDATLRDHPGDVTLARARAREVINFRRSGRSQAIANMRTVVPFLNAFTQGMEVMLRAALGRQQQVNVGGLQRPSGQDFNRNRARFWGLATKMGVFMTLYAATMAGDEEYEGMEEWARDRFFLIPGTKGVLGEQSIRLPIPPEVGFLFKAIPERTVRYFSQQGFADGQSGTEFLKGLAGAAGRSYVSPNLIPQAYRTPLELAVNHSFFLDQPIEGWGMQHLNKSQRFSSSTTELGKALSRVLSSDGSNFGLSPVQADYLIRGLFGMVGTSVAALSDVVIGDKPQMTAQQVGRALTFGTFTSPDTRRGILEQYYGMRDEAQRAYGTVQKVHQRGGDARTEFERYRHHLANRGAFNQLDKMMSDTRRRKQDIERMVRENRISPKEGRERIRRIDNWVEDRLLSIMPNLQRNARSGP